MLEHSTTPRASRRPDECPHAGDLRYAGLLVGRWRFRDGGEHWLVDALNGRLNPGVARAAGEPRPGGTVASLPSELAGNQAGDLAGIQSGDHALRQTPKRGRDVAAPLVAWLEVATRPWRGAVAVRWTRLVEVSESEVDATPLGTLVIAGWAWPLCASAVLRACERRHVGVSVDGGRSAGRMNVAGAGE